MTLASLDLDADPGDGPRRAGQDDPPDLTIDEARAEDYDALLLPGGVGNPDRLRTHEAAMALIRRSPRRASRSRRSATAPWLLVEADLLRGRRATSWPSIRTDLRNAGAEVVDEAAVTDGNIVTSRKPDDVPAFTEALIAAIEAKAERPKPAGKQFALFAAP